MANVPEDLEAGRKVLELLADLGTHPAALATTGRASLLAIGQVVLDLDPFQVLGQLLPTVLVAVFRPAHHQRLARFLDNAGLVERKLLDGLAEEQKLPGIELLAARAVVAPQDGGHGGLYRFVNGRPHRLVDLSFHRFVDRRLTLLAFGT